MLRNVYEQNVGLATDRNGAIGCRGRWSVRSAREEFLSYCFAPATNTPWRVGQVRYGNWRPLQDSGSEQVNGESVVLTPIADDHFEIHGHGGAAAVSRIMDSLVQLGAAVECGSTWQQHVLHRGDSVFEPLIAEAEHVLTQCTTRPNAAIALQQYHGALLEWTKNWIIRLDEQPLCLSDLRAAASVVLDRYSIGRHLSVPYRVVLAGPPNVGKSSLVNRIVGYGRSITHDEAGTTRDVVECDTVIGGIVIRLGDTAGIRSGGGVIEREGIRRGSLAIAAADLVLVVVDPMTANELRVIEQTVAELSRSAVILRVLNKADRIDSDSATGGAVGNCVQTIATARAAGADPGCGTLERGDGITDLVTAIGDRLRPASLEIDAPIPINDRQVRRIEAVANAVNSESAIDQLRRLRSGSE